MLAMSAVESIVIVNSSCRICVLTSTQRNTISIQHKTRSVNIVYRSDLPVCFV
jgi:hypothetical protein